MDLLVGRGVQEPPETSMLSPARSNVIYLFFTYAKI